jgi:Protein of unknown function, DUF481
VNRDVPPAPVRRWALGGWCRLLAGLGAMTAHTELAHAQVNVEPLRGQIAETGFGARVAASVSSYAGNTQGIIFGSAALAGGQWQRHLGFVALSGDYTRLNDVVSVAKWFGHARHNYRLSNVLWWEAFGQLESDRFRRVTFRRLLGTGPRARLFGSGAVELFLGAAYMLEHSNLETGQSRGAGEGTMHRLSSYAAVTLRAHPKIVVTSVTYAQPRLNEPADFRILTVNQADFEITDRLHSRIDATVRYDRVGPSDLSRTDLELKNSLELVF